MNTLFNTYKPEGFSTVNAYLFVEHPQELISFLKNAFYAEELDRTVRPDNGDIANCILRIGASCFMISQARGQFLNMRTALYLYVDDVDALYARAITQGATSEFKPADMEYGDRQAGVVDPSGNYWWISKRLQQKGYHEA